MVLASGSLLGHYEIRSKLGAGGMGEVYLAHDIKLGRTVALKLLPEELAHDRYRTQRFIQEAQAASAINHPNVCVIHEVGESEDGRSFIAMEYVEGNTLASRIKEHPLSPKEILDIGFQVADGLSEAHSKGIIHRDIKPSNIAITPRGQAKVLDFGLARILPPERPAALGEISTQAKSETGILLGTVDYMSPEQALGRPVDARSDIFSLGVVLFEMATGQKPFATKNPLETIDRIAHAEPAPISRLNRAISPELQAVISKCLQKDPARRYQSAKELMKELTALRQEVRPRLYRRLTEALAVFSLLLVVLWIPTVRQSLSQWLGFMQLPPQKYLVVLPFRAIGSDPAAQAFADGLTETLTSRLSLLEQFHQSMFVVPAVEVRDRGVTSIAKAQAAFGVTLVVSGSVQREKERVQLTLNLSDAKTLRQLRSAVADYVLSNVAALQDGVVAELARMLDLEFRPEMHQILTARRTQVPAAYDLYVQGRGYLLRFDDLRNIDAAISLFERAVQEDPGYTLAHASLGEAYWRKYETTNDQQWVAKAVSNCERAAQLDDDLREVHLSLGLVSAGTGRNEAALQHFRRVLQLDPTNADAHRGMARVYEALGSAENLEGAEAHYRKAIELRPAYWAGYTGLGRFYYRQGRYADAEKQFQKVLTLTPDNFRDHASLGAVYYHLERFSEALKMYQRSIEIQPNLFAYTNLAVLYFHQGHYLEAATAFEKAMQLSPQDYQLRGYLAASYYWAPGHLDKAVSHYQVAARMAEEQRKINPRRAVVLSDLAGYYGVLGDRAKALPLIKEMLLLAPRDVHIMFHAALTYEQLGERDQALKWIAEALAKGYSRAEVEQNPWLSRLRSDKRFQQLTNGLAKPAA